MHAITLPVAFRRPLAWLQRYRWRFSSRLAHWRRALAYGRGTLTREQAAWMVGECERVTGWYPLEAISVSSTLEDALTLWEDHPDLERLAADATAHVGMKWESSGDASAAAYDWAIDLIAEYAAAEGIELVRVDDERDGMGNRLDGTGEED